MCGINGIYKSSLGPDAAAVVNRMNETLKHRGPDDSGTFADETVAIGQRRLSIIDLSSAGHQPMHSSDNRLVIVYNGELYNYRELRLELERVPMGSPDVPYRFVTQTDTEVILAAYLRWGENCLQRFNGMYGFAIYDKDKRTLFIARDRLGIKPIYYARKNETLVFSSEIRALLSAGLTEKTLNYQALNDYLRYQTVHAPDTILSEVHMLMPGHYLMISGNSITEQCYWKATDFVQQANQQLSYKDTCNQIKDLLEKSVKRRLISDVPFGAFLSGGIDSSAVVGLMSRVSTRQVKTFSVVFDDPKFSEGKYAKLIAKKFGTEHHEILLTPDDFKNELESALDAMDHPSGDGPNTYVVSKATKQAGITMALSGLGGDELFAGYDIFKRSIKLNQFKWMAAIPGKSIAGLLYRQIKPGTAADKIAELLDLNSFDFKHTYPLSRQVLSESFIQKLTGTHYNQKNVVAEMLRKTSWKKGSYLSAVSLAEISTYMQNVLLRDTDQMSMAHALEVRVPFLDYTLVEFVLSVNDEFKFPHTPKKLLIDSLGDLLPPEIVNRPKMGFTLPWATWLQKDFRAMTESNLNRLKQRNILQPAAVDELWKRFLGNDPRISWSRVWYLVVLEHWLHKMDVHT